MESASRKRIFNSDSSASDLKEDSIGAGVCCCRDVFSVLFDELVSNDFFFIDCRTFKFFSFGIVWKRYSCVWAWMNPNVTPRYLARSQIIM